MFGQRAFCETLRAPFCHKEDPVHIESRHVIDQPADDVYHLVRDQIQVIVPYLPNVRRIDTLGREAAGPGRTEVVNHWYAIAEVPTALSKVIKPEFFSWRDQALWTDETRSVSYRLESALASDLYDARGVNTFTALAERRTELRVACDVEIHADRIPGVPRFVLNKLLPSIEKLLGLVLEPNLRSLGKGLTSYFADQGTSAAGRHP
jgi:hypothetical protein